METQMPRHMRERPKEEKPIAAVLDSMVTYEDYSRINNISFSWFNDAYNFIRWPVPSKMYELTIADDFEFTTRKSQFFRLKRKENEREGGSIASISDDEDDEPDNGSQCSVKSYDEEGDGWKMFDCYRHCQQILFWSRIYILILQFIGANFFGDFFHTDAFRGADETIRRSAATSKVRDSSFGRFVIDYLFAGLRRWDAQYFLFIIDNEYLMEKCLAFFPGFVVVMRIFRMASEVYLTMLFKMQIPKWVVTSFLVVGMNMLFFHLAGLILFVLTYQVCRSVKIGMLAVSLFAYNPASIFFSAAYSESLFALCTFSPLVFTMVACRLDSFMAKSIGVIMAAVFFAAGILVRTNGLLNFGFAMWYMLGAMCWENEIPYEDMRKYHEKLTGFRNRRAREDYQRELNELDMRKCIARKEFRFTMKGKKQAVTYIIIAGFTLIILATILPPFIIYGQSITPEFCVHNSSLAAYSDKWARMMRTNDEVRPGHVEQLEWCKKPYLLGIWPTFYSHIQSKYWDVGFFRYWQYRKIPCFLLAAPAFILTAFAIRVTYRDVFEERKWFNIWVLFGRTDHLLPFAIHAAFLMFMCLFVINAEVFTRIIFSSTPFLYVFLAEWIDELTKGTTYGNSMIDYAESYGLKPMFISRRVWNSGIWGKLLYIYFFSYFIFGTIAHAGWLPFT